MEDRRNKITSKQYMVMTISSQVGIGIFCQPYKLAVEAGHDGWISLILSGIFSIILCILIVKLMERYGDKSIFEIDKYIYGKYIGTFINITLILYLGLKGMIALKFLVEVVHTTVLPLTPPIILSLILFIPTLYLCWYGLKPLCRFANMILISMLFVAVLCVLQLRFFRIEFLMPVGASISIPSVLSAVSGTAYSFLSFGNIAVIYPYIEDKGKAARYTITGIIISTAFFIFVSVTVTGFFGENMLRHLVFPLLSLSQSIKVPVIERIDLFFLVIWFPALAMTLRMYTYVTYNGINKLFNIKKKTISLILLAAAMFFLSRIPNDFAQIYKYVSFSEYVGIPLDFGLATLNYILSFIIKKGVKQK